MHRRGREQGTEYIGGLALFGRAAGDTTAAPFENARYGGRLRTVGGRVEQVDASQSAIIALCRAERLEANRVQAGFAVRAPVRCGRLGA